MFISEFIPIQIKESEFLIPVEKNTTKTIWGDDFIKDHFPSLKNCTKFKRQDYLAYSDDEADFDESITRSLSYTYTIDASQDVELGQNVSVYQDKNYYIDGKFYGINKATGSVVTHFAFYY